MERRDARVRERRPVLGRHPGAHAVRELAAPLTAEAAILGEAGLSKGAERERACRAETDDPSFHSRISVGSALKPGSRIRTDRLSVDLSGLPPARGDVKGR